MRMQKRVLLIIAAAVLILLGVWRFWPRSLTRIGNMPETGFSKARANTVIFATENGNLKMDTYVLDISGRPEKQAEMIKILSSVGYRQDLRNLVSWLWNGISVSGSDKTASVFLSWGSDAEESCRIEFLSGGLVAVAPGDGECSFLYHPTDQSVLNEIAGFIQREGELSH